MTEFDYLVVGGTACATQQTVYHVAEPRRCDSVVVLTTTM
jgi:hypothetical protein